jgi:hypothetical protein
MLAVFHAVIDPGFDGQITRIQWQQKLHSQYYQVFSGKVQIKGATATTWQLLSGTSFSTAANALKKRYGETTAVQTWPVCMRIVAKKNGSTAPPAQARYLNINNTSTAYTAYPAYQVFTFSGTVTT